ncbi:MAG: gamma-glutamylcyclotransferase family protein [Planctomycetota bacterium]|jgi:hypothetical protein
MASNLIVGYGTLLLRESMSRTVGDAAGEGKELIPVIVKDFRRLYNYAPPHYTPAFRISEEPFERAAANIEPAQGGLFNGLAFAASEAEVEALDRRESEYDRVSVSLVHFETKEDIGKGEVYLCPPNLPSIIRDVRALLPHWRDIVYARVGAYRIGEAFGRTFDETTFMADGQTLVADAYKDVLHELTLPLPEQEG